MDRSFIFCLVLNNEQPHCRSDHLKDNTMATPIKRSPTLIDSLRSTLKQIERDQEISPDEPAMRELKASILRAIAEMELLKDTAA